MTTIEQISHSDDFFIVVNNKLVYCMVYAHEIAGIGDEAIFDIIRESIVAVTGEEDVPIIYHNWTDKIDAKMRQEKTTRYQAMHLLLNERTIAA